MEFKVRAGVFETNSSSTHSMVITTEDAYKKLENGEAFIYYSEVIFPSSDQIILIKEFKKLYDCESSDSSREARMEEIQEILKDKYPYLEELQTLEEYFSNDRFDGKIEDTYTTPNGEEIVIFGYYGYDG